MRQALCERPPRHGPTGLARGVNCLRFTDVTEAAQPVSAKAMKRQRLPSWMSSFRSVAYCFLVTAAQRGAKTGIVTVTKVIENVVFLSLKKRSTL